MTFSCLKCGYSPEIVPLQIPTHTARFDHLFCSNDCPSDDEEHTFRSFVINGQIELNQLEYRIATVKDLLGELEAARDQLDKAVREHKKILNPMRSMPFDLIREVFLYGAGFDKDVEEYFPAASHSLDLKSAPWVYGRVCRRWKHLSIQIPSLWTRVKIEIGKINSNRFFPTRKQVFFRQLPFGLSLLSSYLGRSNSLPLCVYLDLKSTGSSLSGFSCTSNCDYGISTIVFSHSRRWESLFLPSGQNINAATFLSDSFPLLKNLHLQTSWGSSSIDISAPALRSWSTVGDLGVTLSTTLYGQITDYSNSGAYHSDVLRIVNLLPNLRRLTVRHLKVAFSPEILASPVCLLALNELVLEERGKYVESICALLSSLSCPSLIGLSVTAPVSLEPAIQRFKDQSVFSLQRLDISGSSGVLEGLQNANTLRVLKVRDIEKPFDPFCLCPAPLGNILSLLSVISEPVASADVSDSHTSVVPFPNLDELELHVRDFENRDIMEALSACVYLRLMSLDSGDTSTPAEEEEEAEGSKRAKERRRIGTTSGCSSTSLTPAKVVIVAPDAHARNMLVHPRLGELHLLGYIVNVIAV